MGSVFEITLTMSCAQADSLDLFVTLQNQLDAIEKELSLYQPESPLSRLNRDGRIANQYPHLSFMLKYSLEAYRKTEGAFNVAIEPVLNKIRQRWHDTGQPPTMSELRKLKPLLNVSKVQITPEEIRLLQPGMALTFDGVAKGYAVDQLAQILEENGFHQYLLNFSGNMRWQGLRSDGTPWKIALWNPARQEISVVPPHPSGAIASSGSEINFYSKDKQWHHLIDPKKLKPADFWMQTSIVGAAAIDCDVLSTASFVMSEARIRRVFNKNYPSTQVWVVDEKGQQRFLEMGPTTH